MRWLLMLFGLVGCEKTPEEACEAWYKASCECDQNPSGENGELSDTTAELYCDEDWTQEECSEVEKGRTKSNVPDGYDSWDDFDETQACIAKKWHRSCDYEEALEGCDVPE